MIDMRSRAAPLRPSLTEPFRVHISPRLAPNKTRRRRQLEDRTATLKTARACAAVRGGAVEIARGVGDQAGLGPCPVAAASEAVEHGEGPRRRHLEYRAPAAEETGRSVEIACRVGDQAGLRTCPVAAAGEGVEHGQAPRRV